MTVRLWAAHLAPLGRPSADGRVLDPAGKFTLPTMFPKTRYLIAAEDNHDLNRIGTLTYLHAEDGWLMAGGKLWPPVDATERQLHDLIRAGKLFPQMSLRNIRSEHDGDVVRLLGGTVAGVIAGRDPAWPDTRFHLEES